MDWNLYEYYNAWETPNVADEFKRLVMNQRAELKLAAGVRHDAARIPGALAQAQELEQAAITKYGSKIATLKFILHERNIDPNPLMAE